MTDYSELKRKAQEIRDEVKAGANTANRIGLALEETVKALETENKRAEQEEVSLGNAVQLLQDNTEDLPSIREELDTLVVNDLTTGGADKALSAEMGKAIATTINDAINNIKPVVINGNVTNAADEEDITSEDNLLKLKDRTYMAGTNSGMGYVILRKNKTFAEQVTKANTIYEIRYDFDLDGTEATIPAGCILKFDGGSLNNGSIIGSNTVVQSSLYYIFRNIAIRGSFNPVYYVEWFGGRSDISSNQIYINKAIEEINNTNQGGVLILSGSYEITDSIYLYGKVSIHGEDGYNRSRFKYSKDTSCIKMNFATPNKWAIDIKPLEGYEPIQYNNLYKVDFIGIHEHSRYDIKNIRFAYANNSCIAYGIIRGTNIQSSVFDSLDLSCGSVIGIAIIYSSWNLQIQNSVIYADYCALYLGSAVTQISTSNVELTQGLPWEGIVNVNKEYSVLPILRYETSLPPYINIDSSAIIAENSAITALSTIFQDWDAVIIGTDYNAYLLHPYLEAIKKTIGWLYTNNIYGPDLNRKQLVVNNCILGLYKTESYMFGTVRGIIETYNVGCGRYYTPLDEVWDYKSYIIHLPPRGTNMAAFYYDNFEVIDNAFTNLSVCPYKVLLFNDGDVEPLVSIANTGPYNPDYLHTNPTLLYGYSPSSVTFDEFCKRELYPKTCRIKMLTNATLCDSGGHILKDRKLIFVMMSSGRYIRVTNNPIKIQNCSIVVGDTQESTTLVLFKNDNDQNVTAYFEVYANNAIYFDKCAIYNIDNVTNGAYLFKLSGDAPINLTVQLSQNTTFVGTISLERLVVNPDYEYPYEITFIKGSDKYYFTNVNRPTMGLPINYKYFDTTINKPIWWTGSKWVDSSGATV